MYGEYIRLIKSFSTFNLVEDLTRNQQLHFLQVPQINSVQTLLNKLTKAKTDEILLKR